MLWRSTSSESRVLIRLTNCKQFIRFRQRLWKEKYWIFNYQQGFSTFVSLHIANPTVIPEWLKCGSYITRLIWQKSLFWKRIAQTTQRKWFLIFWNQSYDVEWQRKWPWMELYISYFPSIFICQSLQFPLDLYSFSKHLNHFNGSFCFPASCWHSCAFLSTTASCWHSVQKVFREGTNSICGHESFHQSVHFSRLLQCPVISVYCQQHC